jgi:hypothetical protein
VRVAWKTVEALLGYRTPQVNPWPLPTDSSPATILGGHLHIRGLPDRGPWNPSRLEWDDEAFVDILLSTRQADRKVRTREKLEAVMKESKKAPTREVWMHESLMDEARRLWEEMKTNLR